MGCWGLVIAVGGCLWLLALAGGGYYLPMASPRHHWSCPCWWWPLITGGISPSPGTAGPVVVSTPQVLLLFPHSPPLSRPAASLCSLGTHLGWAGVCPILAGGYSARQTLKAEPHIPIKMPPRPQLQTHQDPDQHKQCTGTNGEHPPPTFTHFTASADLICMPHFPMLSMQANL
jgi:hypothetical protein